MISEEKKEINEEMVQRVISGKIDTGGLLKQKKKNYNEIAVNKLLDVLRKDSPQSAKEEEPPNIVNLGEDDWIGGEIDNKKEPLSGKPKPNSPKETPVLNVAEQRDPPGQLLKKNKSHPPVGKTFSGESSHEILEPKKWTFNEDDFLPSQGKAPKHITSSFLDKFPVDKTVTGLHIDSGKFYAVIISEDKGIKTLLAYREFSTKDRKLDHSKTQKTILKHVRKY